MVDDEPETTAWFAIKMGPRTFGIFDTFANERGREAHLNGRVAAQLTAKPPQLSANLPEIQRVEVIAQNCPIESNSKSAVARFAPRVDELENKTSSRASYATLFGRGNSECSQGEVLSLRFEGLDPRSRPPAIPAMRNAEAGEQGEMPNQALSSNIRGQL